MPFTEKQDHPISTTNAAPPVPEVTAPRSIDDPLASVRTLTKARIELLKKLGMETVSDLLFEIPRDIVDLTQLSKVHELTDTHYHAIKGVLVDRDARTIRGNRTIVSLLLKCDGGFVRGSWFNQAYMLRKFEPNETLLFSGQPKFRDHRWEFTHPIVQRLDEEDQGAAPGILPKYRLTEGLSMVEMRRITRAAVEEFASAIPDPLPDEFRRQLDLPHLRDAAVALHCAESAEAYNKGRERILFDDLFEFQLGLAMRRRFWRSEANSSKIALTAKIDSRIRRLFPFQFTPGQESAIAEIAKDLDSPIPMHRLLQADVGAGKTAVAVYAMLLAVANGYQAALMAPTEILAQQHWQTLQRLLGDSRVNRRYLAGQMTPRERQAALHDIRTGEAQIVVGTQALIQEGVEFPKLGLVVIDEQHKFGVMQRARFSDRPDQPHVLVMTATPIPRTLSLTQFGDLDSSVITDLPPGRQKIITSVITDRDEARKAWDFLKGKIHEGRQLYVVCPRIEPDEEGDLRDTSSAINLHRILTRGELAEFDVRLLHGRMNRDERTEVMESFRNGDCQVLVATTVIEVGVDVPNATMMVVFHSDRYGLSQLHQLRGRIGRGKFQGYCFLFTSSETEEAMQRLGALEQSSNGFDIAEADFSMRGPGDVLGTRQHGALPLKRADLVRDSELVVRTREQALALVESGRFDEPEFVPLKMRVLDRFGKLMDLPQSG